MAFAADTVVNTNNPPQASSGIGFIRQDLRNMFVDYDLVLDCIEGSKAVKNKRIAYLPMPDATNLEQDNIARYDAYVTRAVFYNVTQRTALGLQGQIFLRAPIVKYPTALEPVITDSNGSGISVEQLARDAVWIVASCGRGGLFVDYPPREGVATRAELASGNVRPTMSIYGPKNVINWRTKRIGSKEVLTLVVLLEKYTVEDDGFETVEAFQYRELRLVDDKYVVNLWRAPEPRSTDFKITSTYNPTDGKGKRLDAIPFTFMGSKNNETSIDPPPLLDMANINIAHYRNSADYEEAVFIVGQPMLTVIGLSSEWLAKELNGTIKFGSRAGLPLPVGADAKILQVTETTMAFDAMAHKERQMVALGAKIVEQREVQQTATESSNSKASEESVLSAIAKNVSFAVKWGLEWCAVYLGVPEEGIEFSLNTDFELARMSAEDRNSVIKAWQDTAISWTEMRGILHKAGIATEDDEKAKAEIEKDGAAAIAKAAEEMAATTKAVTDNSPPPNA